MKIFSLVQGLATGLLMLALDVITHEYAHLLVGRALGLKTIGPYWSPELLAPAVGYDVSEWSWQLTLALYSGGLVAAVPLFATYFLLVSKGLVTRNRMWWSLSAWIWMLAFYQAGQGIIEGAYHDMYIARHLAVFYAQVAMVLLGAVTFGAMHWRDVEDYLRRKGHVRN